jgi:hypothetical protein
MVLIAYLYCLERKDDVIVGAYHHEPLVEDQGRGYEEDARR